MTDQPTPTPAYSPAFGEYATRVAFDIKLSRIQIITLTLVEGWHNHKGTSGYPSWPGQRSRQNADLFIPGFRSLESKGLAEHNPAWLIENSGDTDRDVSWVYRLTPAGQHIMALLRIAGIVPALEEPKRAAA